MIRVCAILEYHGTDKSKLLEQSLGHTQEKKRARRADSGTVLGLSSRMGPWFFCPEKKGKKAPCAHIPPNLAIQGFC